MEWSDKINNTINYIEKHLDDEIDYIEAARISCCSLNKLQRLFLFVTDMTLSEYVRQRRMTLAAYDLLNSDIKIIDLALKYDYESPEAFTRAFQTFHGYPPTVTRKFGIYKKYDRISIQVKIHGGNTIMNTDQNKKVIENVCSIGWGETSANPYVGAVTACMDALREGNDFRLAGMISGVGFAYTWFPGAPNDANIVDDAMIFRTFNALGYKISIYRDSDTHNSLPSRDKTFYMEHIVSSINKGYPVLGFGFTNNYPFACTILGYENCGEKLYLRSYWDDDSTIDEQTGYQCTTEWYKRCHGIVIIEEKLAPAITGKALIKHCLQTAVALSEQNTIQFYDLTLPYGLATYDTMIAVLEDNGFWGCRDDAFIYEMDRSYSCVGLLLSDHYKNWIASHWLKENSDISETGKIIKQGCDYYNLLGWLIKTMIGDRRTFLENPLELVNWEVRESKIPFIQIVKHLDACAVGCFKKALEMM